ncbi:hypothetical protein EZV62_015346 [Acer yangbiense]|uniref:Uncharacterized protein n=1 Tax=Acer yangbiense TaxID=1000413 RepID=A0A5C7HKG3_9ROSI|nr:hypothetical protein EZV62_015346 [Acer yangbiense]
MSLSIELLSIKNPNHRLSYGSGSLKRASSSYSPSLRSEARACQVSISAGNAVPPKGRLGVGFRFSDRTRSFNRTIFVSAASHEESKPSEIEIEKDGDDINIKAEESEETWKQALASFKEQALKMQSVSQEAYEMYSKKALVILKETSEQLKIQAEKAREDLTVIAKEIGEEGKEYLTTATKNAPQPVKEIAQTFSADDLDEFTNIRDFHLGIPYGFLLSFGGFLSFMITGSISAVRFGVILGGTLLALSISSLKSYQRNEKSAVALKGQAAIATIIFLREVRCFSQVERLTFPNFLTISLSGAMVAFYIYRITVEGKWRKGSNLEHGTEN